MDLGSVKDGACVTIPMYREGVETSGGALCSGYLLWVLISQRQKPTDLLGKASPIFSSPSSNPSAEGIRGMASIQNLEPFGTGFSIELLFLF